MIRKNIFGTLLTLLAGSLLPTACMFSQEDVFDEPAANRINTVNDDLQQRLVAQSTGGNQGWVIQYFVGDGEHEGFNIFASFDANGKVTLASDHRYLRNGKANTYTEHTSLYKMLAEEGPVLSFITWNDVLTVFADPVDPDQAPNTLVKDGEGMFGDYNLVFNGYEGDNILFRGERHGTGVRFIPCDRPWTTYIADVANLRKKIVNNTIQTFYLVNGTDTMYYQGLYDGTNVQHIDRPEDPLYITSFNSLFTLDGFRLNRADTLSGASFQQFHLAADNTLLLSEDEKVKVIPTWDLYVSNCATMLGLNPEYFTAEQTALYQQMEAEVKKVNANFVLDSIGIVRTSETITISGVPVKVKYPGLVACVHGPKKMGRVPLYYPYVNMGIYKPTYGVLKFEESAEETSTAMSTFAATDLKTMLKQFAATLYGTYDMTIDNTFRPTRATLTPTEGGVTQQLVMPAIKD